MRCDAVGGGAAEEKVRVALAPRVLQRGAESRQFGACDDEEEEQQAHREQRHTCGYMGKVRGVVEARVRVSVGVG